MSTNITLSLFGNPNCGKTAVFNLLTGLDQKVSNYPGITVEKKIAKIKEDDINITLEDFPGSYSLISQSADEKIVSDTVIKWLSKPLEKPDAILYVADVTNLRRNLYFLTQLLSFDVPVILLLNMSDLVNVEDIVDVDLLKENLSIYNVIPFSAANKNGVNKLKDAIKNLSKDSLITKHNAIQYTNETIELIKPLYDNFLSFYPSHPKVIEQISLAVLSHDNYNDYFSIQDSKNLEKIKNNILSNIADDMKEHIKTMDSNLRYVYLDEILSKSNYKTNSSIENVTASEKIDKVLTHKWFGPLIYVSILYFIFQSIFTWSSIPMDFIDNIMGQFGNLVYSYLPDGWFRDLIVDGVIAGIGGIVIFLPQIILLMLFMTLLEDTGYMTRVSFMMDKFMRKIGLHGKSILPIMSGYACAIPGIISARTIDSWKERLITILVLPLISCGARLPVYVLMIGAFIPQTYIYNFIGLQGFVMVVMYFLGTITAFVLAKVFSKLLSERSNPTFIMELPPYRKPIFTSVVKQVYNRGKLFLINAGKIIMAISIILWFLASYPKNEHGEIEINQSYAGKMGQFIEPVISPLGFDWKIGIGLITSFAAREVVVSTLSTIYNVSDDGEEMVSLKEAMRNDINPKTGKNTYNPIVALSLMVFYVYAAQCMATFAIVKTETNSWKWPMVMIAYMSILAYMMSLFVYQIGIRIFY